MQAGLSVPGSYFWEYQLTLTLSVVVAAEGAVTVAVVRGGQVSRASGWLQFRGSSRCFGARRSVWRGERRGFNVISSQHDTSQHSTSLAFLSWSLLLFFLLVAVLWIRGVEVPEVVADRVDIIDQAQACTGLPSCSLIPLDQGSQVGWTNLVGSTGTFTTRVLVGSRLDRLG